jgi:hypothetical protein
VSTQFTQWCGRVCAVSGTSMMVLLRTKSARAAAGTSPTRSGAMLRHCFPGCLLPSRAETSTPGCMPYGETLPRRFGAGAHPAPTTRACGHAWHGLKTLQQVGVLTLEA